MQRRLVAAFSGLLLLTACGTSSETDTTGASTQPTTGMQTQQPRGDVSTAVGQYRPGSQEELAQTIGDRVFFDYDRHDLDAQGRNQVEGWAGWLRKYPDVSAKIGRATCRGRVCQYV